MRRFIRVDTYAMRDKSKYYDDDGLYITKVQLQLFLNSKDGYHKYKECDDTFLKYYTKCRAYNLISDMMEKDPSCAQLCWDSSAGEAVFTFPARGKVAKIVSKLKLLE